MFCPHVLPCCQVSSLVERVVAGAVGLLRDGKQDCRGRGVRSVLLPKLVCLCMSACITVCCAVIVLSLLYLPTYLPTYLPAYLPTYLPS